MNKEDYIKEKQLANQPTSFDPDEMSILIELVKTHICKIKCKDGNGTGFFCNIPIGWGNHLAALMTNNHVLNINNIQPGQTINFSINNDEKEFNIVIDNNRKTYTNDFFDVTIIEIKEGDKIDEKSFFEIDKQIFEDSIDSFKNRQICLLHYPKGIKREISFGIIQKISDDEERKTIYHLCDTSGGSSGSPIINKTNFQVIGIHKGAPTGGQNHNLGTLLKEPIEKFNEEIKMNKNNIKDNNKDNNKNINNKDNIIKENEKVEINKIIINDNNNINENKELNNNDENIDEITIKYKIEDIKYSKDIKIFGKDFVENNKSICKIIINGNEFELSENININIIQLKNNKFEIKLKGIKNITNMSYMFKNCSSLSSLPDISKWNTQNVTDMSFMFCDCSFLSSLPDISIWNTQNVTNMSSMFKYCSSLSSLPDISKWNTQNVTYMNSMLENCSSLSSLPDISIIIFARYF